MQRWLRHLPNLISSIRILLIIPITLTLVQGQLVATLWLFAVAAATDAVDGFLARRFGWQTELGGMLDPLADKLMLATVFITFATLGTVPWWLTGAVLVRDIIIVAGAVSYRLWLGPVAAQPSIISKLNTVCQMLYLLAVIGNRQFAWPQAGCVVALGALAFVTVVVSGIDYVSVYGRRAAAAARARGSAAGTGDPL